MIVLLVDKCQSNMINIRGDARMTAAKVRDFGVLFLVPEIEHTAPLIRRWIIEFKDCIFGLMGLRISQIIIKLLTILAVMGSLNDPFNIVEFDNYVVSVVIASFIANFDS